MKQSHRDIQSDSTYTEISSDTVVTQRFTETVLSTEISSEMANIIRTVLTQRYTVRWPTS